MEKRIQIVLHFMKIQIFKAALPTSPLFNKQDATVSHGILANWNKDKFIAMNCGGP